MGALQALIPFAIITGALGVAGNLLGWIPVLTRGERKRRVGDEWQYAMWQRDTAIKKEFK